MDTDCNMIDNENVFFRFMYDKLYYNKYYGNYCKYLVESYWHGLFKILFFVWWTIIGKDIMATIGKFGIIMVSFDKWKMLLKTNIENDNCFCRLSIEQNKLYRNNIMATFDAIWYTYSFIVNYSKKKFILLDFLFVSDPFSFLSVGKFAI